MEPCQGRHFAAVLPIKIPEFADIKFPIGKNQVPNQENNEKPLQFKKKPLNLSSVIIINQQNGIKLGNKGTIHKFKRFGFKRSRSRSKKS